VFPVAEFFLKKVVQFLAGEVHGHGFSNKGIQQRFEAPAAFFAGKDFSLANNENAASGTGFDQTVAGKVSVGARDGIGVEDQVFGQSADTGKLVANAQFASGNSHADLLGDLPVDGGGGAGADGDANVHLLYYLN